MTAIRPPEYFPRLPYATVLLVADRFVVADTFPYSRQSTQNRCRIRTPGEGGRRRSWLTVPVAGGAPGRPIRQVEIAPDSRWRQVHRKTLLHHYGSAPFFDHYRFEIEALIERPAATLPDLTVGTVHWSAAAIGSRADIVLASDLPGQPSTLRDVLEEIGSDELLTLDESSQADHATAVERGVRCRVLPFTERPRRQNFPGFVGGCGSLDLVLNHGPESAAYLMQCLEP